MTWSTTTSQPAAIRCWGQECVVYDVDSGNTHLVTAAAARILERLQQSPADLPTLHAYSVEPTAPGDDSLSGTALEALLADLQRAELVRRSS